jgi:DNA mismatch repair protein MutS2
LKDTLDNAVIPFSFSSSVIKSISENMRKRSAQDSYETYLKVSSELEQYLDVLGKIGAQLFELGLIVSLYEFSKAYDLNFCEVVDEGVGFIGSRNIFLVQEQIKGNIKIQSVDYSLGKTSLEIFGAKTSSVVLLTGANSGGKTTLLMTIAQIVIMNLLGLPVPAKKAEALVAGIYLFRRRTVRKLGSLEHALKSMTPILTRRGKKLILMDEFEALTEPKAIARIIAAFMNNLRKQSLALFVTHLAVDIIPHINVDYRIDGIEATGVDGEGNLIVNRQPTFNKLGTSSPELIVEKLKKTTKNKRASKAYDEMLKLLRNVKVERKITQK